MGAKAGLSTAPDSAICKNNVSIDRLYGGRSNSTTPSARSPGPIRRRLRRKSTTASCSAVDQCSCLISFPDLSWPPNWICGGINRMACLLAFTTENRTITCWPPSRTSLMPVRKRSPFTSSLSGRSPYSTGSGACCWRSNKLSRESVLGWVGTFSTGELAVVSEAGNNAAPAPEGLATEETTAACAFDTLAVCATRAKGTASGSTRKPPDGWYRSRKSTLAEFGPSPPLTRRKLIWRPLAVEISKLLSACSLVRALTKTSSGSCSECSTWNRAGSPTTTEFTGSGTRIAVTKCAASSIEVILLSAVGLVRTCGTMVVCCAPAVAVSTASESHPRSKAFLIPSPQLFPLPRQLTPCPKHSSCAIPLRDPFDVPLNIGGGIGQSPRRDFLLANVVGRGDQPKVAVELLFEPGKICDTAANVLLHQKSIAHSEPHSRCGHQLHDPSRAFLRYRIRIPSRFFVDNRGHQFHRDLVDSGVILSPPCGHVSWCACVRHLRPCGSHQQHEETRPGPFHAAASTVAAGKPSSATAISSSR